MAPRGKPKKARAKAKRPLIRPKDDSAKVRDLEKSLAEALSREAEASRRVAEMLGQLQTRDREVAEALERQTATSEILRVIASSPTDVQPVFDAIVQNAGRLCGAASAALNIADGDVQRKVAEFGAESFLLRIGDSRPITRGSLTGRALMEARPIQIDDMRDPEMIREYPDFRYPPGTRACLAIPLLREGSPPVGCLFIFRTDGGPFTERHIALLQTFADQAVIAIENVRLFNELHASNNDLTRALEQQTATSEILRVISTSPSDAHPVFDRLKHGQ